MKDIYKYILLTAMLTLAAGSLRAQNMTSSELFPEDAARRRTRLRIEWRVFAGASFVDWSADTKDISFDPKVGYHAGFDIGLLFGRRCALVPELRFTHSAVNITGKAGGVAQVKSNVLDFPLMFEYRILRGRLRFHAGPSFTLMDRNEYRYRGEDADGLQLRPTVTYVVGASGLIGRRVLVGVRFNGRFNRTEQIMGLNVEDPDYMTYRLGSYRLSVSLGYRF